MIKDESFTKEWLQSFRTLPEHSRINLIILEKMIYALHLLENLAKTNLKFIFKGGTSLTLLIKNFSRFSIDIDIISPASISEIEQSIAIAVKSSRFKSFILDEKRSFRPGVPKLHYQLLFESQFSTSYSGEIQLDILLEDSIYTKTKKISISNKWIAVDGVVEVTVPTIEAITGDKLTTIAAPSIGIPYYRNGISLMANIVKQIFDLGSLFDCTNEVKEISDNFLKVARKEIGYRVSTGNVNPIEPYEILNQIITSSAVFARRETGSVGDRQRFNDLIKGLNSFGSGYLTNGKFNIEEAITSAGKVALLAAKIRTEDFSPILKYQGDEISHLTITSPEWNFLNKLKRLPDKSAFYYWYRAAEILIQANIKL